MDSSVGDELAADLAKAMRLFLKGAALEDEGQLRDAVDFYRRAVQLVPDVEQRVHELSLQSGASTATKEKPKEANVDKKTEFVEEDLPLKFAQIIAQQGAVCLSNTPPEGTHISHLPQELILLLLRWVVSSELDLRSLCRFSEVCRGFYLTANDNELWRLICRRAWGCSADGRRKWRTEFDRRPRVRVDGCYMARVTYVRPGELSFQTSAYMPWHTVQYYRLFRFFTGGLALMLTTAEQPNTSVAYLRSRRTANPQVLCGHYRVNSNKLFVEFNETPRPRPRINPQRRNQPIQHDSGHKRYLLELEVKGPNKLVWLRYCIETIYKNAPKSICEFELSQSQFPDLNFARVRSYFQIPAQEML